MKSMKNTLLLAIVAAGCAAVGTAQATVVDIQFVHSDLASSNSTSSNGTTGNYGGSQGAYTGDAVAAPTWNVLSVYWASTSGSMSSLVTSNGTASTDAVSFTTSTGPFASVATSPPNSLLQNFLRAGNSVTDAVTITGLADSGSYQLYLYSASGSYNNAATDFSISTGTGGPALGSNAVAINSGTSSGTFQENANYLIFNATASSNGTLAISYSGAPGHTEGDFNGLQVISTTAVPEPASLSLLGAAALGLLLLGRKRKTA